MLLGVGASKEGMACGPDTAPACSRGGGGREGVAGLSVCCSVMGGGESCLSVSRGEISGGPSICSWEVGEHLSVCLCIVGAGGLLSIYSGGREVCQSVHGGLLHLSILGGN